MKYQEESKEYKFGFDYQKNPFMGLRWNLSSDSKI